MAEKSWHEKLADRFKKIIADGDRVYEDEDIVDAIRDNVDIDDLAKEIVAEDPEIKEALRDKVRELILQDIENIDDINDIINGDLGDFFPDLEPMVSELLVSNDEIRKALEEAINKSVVDAIEDLDYEELGIGKAFEKFDFASFASDAMRYGNLEDLMRRRVLEVAKEYVEDYFSPDDLPENFPQIIGLNNELERAVKSPQFQDKLREELLPFLVNNFKDVLRRFLFSDDSPYRQNMENVARSMLSNMFRM